MQLSIIHISSSTLIPQCPLWPGRQEFQCQRLLEPFRQCRVLTPAPFIVLYLYLIYLYLDLISGNNPGDNDESHRNNPRLIEGYPDFHSVPKLFKADPGMIHLLILTIQDILLNVARPGILFKPISRGGVQPTPLVLQRLVSSQFINCKFPPKFLSEETKVCSAFTWLVLRSVLNMDTKSLPEGGPSGKV